MPFRVAAHALVAIAAFAAMPSSAQNIKPGLWEINNKMQSSNGQLEQAMAMMHEHVANMSPEQRKQIDDLMAKNGVQMPTPGANGAMVVKMCMTREMAARKEIPFQQHGNCTQRQSPMVGNTMKVSFNCTQPQASGEGQVTFQNDAAYAMRMRVTSAALGKPETMNMEATARWLGAECGSVAPAR